MRVRLIFFSVFILIISTPVWAQRWDSTSSIGGFGGVNIPVTPSAFKAYTKTSPGFGVELKYNVTDMMSFSVTIHYFTFKRNVNQIEEDYVANNPGSVIVDVDGGKKTLDFFTINIIRYLTSPYSRINFYVLGGMCNYTIEDKAFMLSALSPSNKITAQEKKEHYFGLQGGVGLELAFDGRILVYLESTYRRVLDDDAEALWGEKLGKKLGHLSFLSISFGLRFAID